MIWNDILKQKNKDSSYLFYRTRQQYYTKDKSRKDVVIDLHESTTTSYYLQKFRKMRELLKKRRCLSHRRYVEHRMAQLQSEIFNDAMATGKVNLEKRQQLLKYRTHLNNL